MINFLKKLFPKLSNKTDLTVDAGEKTKIPQNTEAANSSLGNSALSTNLSTKNQKIKIGLLESFDNAKNKIKEKATLQSLIKSRKIFQEQMESSENKIRFRYLVLFGSIIVALLLILPLLIDNSYLKSQLETKISAKIKANITIDSVDIALLPSPKITMNNLVVQNFVKNGGIYDLTAQAIEIKTGFLALLSRKFNCAEIDFYNATLKSYDQLSQAGDRKNSAIDALNKDNNTDSSNDTGIPFSLFSLNGLDNQNLDLSRIPQIKTHNLDFIITDKFSKTKEFNQINLEIVNNKQEISIKGYFLTGNTVNNIELDSSFKKNAAAKSSTLMISSTNLDFKANGAFDLDQDPDLWQGDDLSNALLGLKFNGIIYGQIKNLKRFYQDYFGNDDLIYAKLNPAAEAINFNATINNQKNDIVISNITASSSLINGKGNIEINTRDPKTKIDINFDFNDLDFDSLWLVDAFYISKNPSGNSLANSDQKIISSLDISNQIQTINLSTNPDLNNQNSSLDLKVGIQIKNAKYLGTKLANFNLSASSLDQYSIFINPITFDIVDATAKITGVLKNEDDLKFIGQIDVKGDKLKDLFANIKIESQNLKYDSLKNYTLRSNVMVLPNLTTLDNLSFSLDNKNEFLGSIKIDNSKKISTVTSTFKVNEFNVDDYFLISGQNSYLSSGLLINKVFWLNNISHDHKVTLTFDKLTYKNELFENQTIDMAFGQGYLLVNNLLLKSNNTDLTAALSLDIRGSTPFVSMSLVANKFHYQAALINNQQPVATDQATPAALVNNKNNFTDQFFALPSLTGFDGKIDFKIDNLILDQMEAKNLKITGQIKDGTLDFSNFNAEILGGKIEYKGSVIIRSEKLINGNITFSNINLRPMLGGLFNLNNVDGISNIAASIRASADNKKDFIRDIESNIKFSIRSLEIDGYGLTSLMTKLFDPLNNLQDLATPEAILFNKDAKTIFDTTNGELNISKNSENKFRANISSLAINAVVLGNINLVQKDVDLNANIIFLTGTRKKQIPLNIVSTIRGYSDNLAQNTNLDQVKQYLQMINPLINPTITSQATPSNLQPTANNFGNAINTTNQNNTTPNNQVPNIANQNNQVPNSGFDQKTDSNQMINNPNNIIPK